jgi:hypothetical protein
VLSTQVAPDCVLGAAFGRTAEVGRLVPTVAGAGQPGDDALEVVLHRVGLASQLLSPGVGEARPRLRLELVAGQVLRLEREGVVEVRLEIGGALAGDPVDEIERDVAKSGITKMMHGAADVVRAGNTLEHLQQLRPEALRAERHARHARTAQGERELGGHRLGIRLDRHLRRRRQCVEQPHEIGQSGERRRAAAQEDRLEPAGKRAALELQLPQQRVDVCGVLPRAADDGDEVAVAAPVRAERQVHVQVACAAAHPALRLGRATSSPPQFGHTLFISAPHAVQNVHSYEQIRASPPGSSAVPQRSHSPRISSAISSFPAGRC